MNDSLLMFLTLLSLAIGMRYGFRSLSIGFRYEVRSALYYLTWAVIFAALGVLVASAEVIFSLLATG